MSISAINISSDVTGNVNDEYKYYLVLKEIEYKYYLVLKKIKFKERFRNQKCHSEMDLRVPVQDYQNYLKVTQILGLVQLLL